MAADGDWQDFYEFQEPAGSVQEQENCNASPEAGAGAHAGGDSFPALASSLEEKLSLCFRPTSEAEPPRAARRRPGAGWGGAPVGAGGGQRPQPRPAPAAAGSPHRPRPAPSFFLGRSEPRPGAAGLALEFKCPLLPCLPSP